MKKFFSAALTFLEAQKSNGMIMAVNGLLILGLLATLIYQGYLIFPLISQIIMLEKSPVTPRILQNKTTQKIRIETLRLFGSKHRHANKIWDTPKWTLKGIVTGSTPDQSGAIIASSGTEDALYRAGSRLKDGSVLKKILQHSVLLERERIVRELYIEWNDDDSHAVKADSVPANAGEPFTLRKSP